MKRIITHLFSALLAGCILPVLFYYGTGALLQQGPAGAARAFYRALQKGAEVSLPLLSPAPADSPLPAGQTAEMLVPIWDTGSETLLQVPLREYLIGAVASEMPISWPDAALQAQAVAAHSYLLYSRDHADPQALHGGWRSADPARRQGFIPDAGLRSYWGTQYTAHYNRLSALVDAVLDTLLLYEGSPACASYFAISNGRTEASQNVWQEALPYLQGVDSSWDKQTEGFSHTITLDSTQMHSALVTGLHLDPGGWLPDAYFSGYQYTDAGYVASVNVCGTPVAGTALREALGLRSSCFSIAWDGKAFSVTTSGYGHGVGLSQTGAMYMAQAGHTWQEILVHYFPGTSLAV